MGVGASEGLAPEPFYVTVSALSCLQLSVTVDDERSFQCVAQVVCGPSSVDRGAGSPVGGHGGRAGLQQ